VIFRPAAAEASSWGISSRGKHHFRSIYVDHLQFPPGWTSSFNTLADYDCHSILNAIKDRPNQEQYNNLYRFYDCKTRAEDFTESQCIMCMAMGPLQYS